MSRIFISHADSNLAVALDRLVRRALGNKVTIFNSSRASGGLAAGQPIDITLLGQIRECDAFLWLTSPESAKRSFWMAWELGAADAVNKSIYPCRSLGMNAAELPLLQSRRYVPDLGSREDLAQFLQTLADGLGVPDTMIAEAVETLYIQHPVATPFDATIDSVLEVTIAGQRLIIENRGSTDISDLGFDVAPDPPASKSTAAMDALLTALGSHSRLGPMDRLLVSLGLPGFELDNLEHAHLLARWNDSSLGRRVQRVQVRHHK